MGDVRPTRVNVAAAGSGSSPACARTAQDVVPFESSVAKGIVAYGRPHRDRHALFPRTCRPFRDRQRADRIGRPVVRRLPFPRSDGRFYADVRSDRDASRPRTACHGLPRGGFSDPGSILFRPLAADPVRITLPFILLLAACSHSEPFTAPDEPLEAPLSPAVPVRLTYADGGPTAPTWTLDGDSVLYSYIRQGGAFSSREEGCLAVLPASGGTIRREICSRSVFPTQFGDIFDLPALSPSGRLAFFHRGQAAAEGTGAEAILVAPFDTPSAYVLVRTFPFQADVFYVAPTSVSWLDDSRLVFIGIAEEQVSPCGGGPCNPILVEYGRAVLAADASTPGTVGVVPGTLFATSVTAGESGDIIYYTVANDSRIFRQALSSGEVTTAHDFGAPAIARDVSFAAGRLVVVVDGSVTVYPDDIGTIQGPNSGGTPYVVVPGSGQAQAVPVPSAMWFRRPALSPDGSRIVAEGALLQISAIRDESGSIVGYDTTPGPSSIWKIPAP